MRGENMPDASSRIVRPFLPIWRRPLGAVLAYSAEMGRRVGNTVGLGVFYRIPQVS
jgi:hypothetical protein